MNTKEFGAVSRVSFKQPTKSGDVFYTFEFSETWSVDPNDQTQLPQLKQALWETVNNQVIEQVKGTKELYRQG